MAKGREISAFDTKRWFSVKSLILIRTERALRFISLLPLALYFTFADVYDAPLRHLTAVIYVILSALIPSTPSTIGLILFMSVPAVFCSLGLISGIIALAQPGGNSTSVPTDVLVIIIFSIWTISIGCLRIGPLASLLNIALCTLIYTSDLFLVQAYYTAKDGISLTIPPTAIMAIAHSYQLLLDSLRKQGRIMLALLIQLFVTLLLDDISPCRLITVDGTNFIIHDGICETHVPDLVQTVDQSLWMLKGVPVHIIGSSTSGISIQLESGKWFLTFLWRAKGPYGIIRGSILYSLTGMALWVGAMLLPPPRFARRVLFRSIEESLTSIRKKCLIMTRTLALNDQEHDKGVYANIGHEEPVSAEYRQQGSLVVTFDYEPTNVKVRNLWKLSFGCRPRKSKVSIVPISKLVQKAQAMKGLLLLSVFEQIVPFGINVHKSNKAFVEAIGHAALHCSYFEKLLLLNVKEESFLWAVSPNLPSEVLSYKLHIQDESVIDQLREIANDSLTLQGISALAACLHPHITSLPRYFSLKTVARRIRDQQQIVAKHYFKLNAMKAREIQCLSTKTYVPTPQQKSSTIQSFTEPYKFNMEATKLSNRLSALHQTSPPLPSSLERRITLSMLTLSQFLETFVVQTVRCSDAALQMLELQTYRSFGAFFKSLIGFISPFFLFLYFWLGTFFRGLFIEPVKAAMRIHHRSSRRTHRRLEFEDNARRMSLLKAQSLVPVSPGVFRYPSKFASMRSRQAHHNFYRLTKYWIVLRFGLGAAFIFGFTLFYRPLAHLHVTSYRKVHLPLGIELHADVLDTSKAVGWTFLGFMVTFMLTWQATVKRAILRSIGVLVGTFLGWLGLVCFEKHSGVLQGLWICFFCFVIVWFATNPLIPELSFQSSWGYAAQVMTYQMTIIIVEVHTGESARNEIILQRLLGQALGIAAALIASLILMPTDVNGESRILLGDAIYHCSMMPRHALYRLWESIDPDVAELHKEMKKDHDWDYDPVMKQFDKSMTDLGSLKADNSLFEEVRCLNTKASLLHIFDCLSRMQLNRQTFKAWTTQAEQTRRIGKSRKTERDLTIADTASMNGSQVFGADVDSLRSDGSDWLMRSGDKGGSPMFVPKEQVHSMPRPDKVSLSSMDEHSVSSRFEQQGQITKDSAREDQISTAVDEQLSTTTASKLLLAAGFKSSKIRQEGLWRRLESDDSHYQIPTVITPVNVMQRRPLRVKEQIVTAKIHHHKPAAGTGKVAQSPVETGRFFRVGDRPSKSPLESEARLKSRRCDVLAESIVSAPSLVAQTQTSFKESAGEVEADNEDGDANDLKGGMEQEQKAISTNDENNSGSLLKTRQKLEEEEILVEWIYQMMWRLVDCLEQLYIIIEMGVHYGGRKFQGRSRTRFPISSTDEYGSVVTDALKWCTDTLQTVYAYTHSTTFAYDTQDDQRANSDLRGSGDRTQVMSSTNTLFGARSPSMSAALAFQHFCFLELQELKRLAHIITNELC